MITPLFSVRAGDTVTHPSFTPAGLPEHAVVLEVRAGSLAELNNGGLVPADELVAVPTDERWAPIAGYEGRYRISSHGKVVSLAFHRTRQRLMRPSAPTRYPAVSLTNAAGTTQTGINRLVAQHFLPPPTEARFTFVLPRDGNRLNLHADNLQWVDPREADDPDVAPRLHRHGERHGNHRLTAAQVAQIYHLATQDHPIPDLARQFGVSRQTIVLIVDGFARRHG